MSDRAARLHWFKTIILPYENDIRLRLRRLCPPGFDLENLVAESLARAYEAKDFERITAGRAYLFTIARNLLLDAIRRDNVVSLDFVADLDMLRADYSLEAVLSARDQLKRLHVAVESLPPQCRKVFILRRVYDYSPKEIAEMMTLSVSTIEKHLAKALRLVAKSLAEIEEERLEQPERRRAERFDARRNGRLLRR